MVTQKTTYCFLAQVNGRVFSAHFQSTMSVDYKSTIEANRNDLLDVLRIGELLLTELCGEDVLEERTKQEILAGGIQNEINGRFLDWLKQSQPAAFAICLEKLRGDQQEHIANVLNGTPGERPLTKQQRKQIQKNMRHLSEMIDVDSGLSMLMYSIGAISTVEQQELNLVKSKQVKAMKLLQVILLKSDRTLQHFVNALQETNQAHVIPTLEKGDIIPLHTEIRTTSDLLHKFEEELIQILVPLAQKISYLNNEDDTAEVQEIKQKLREICHKKIKLLNMMKGKSITIYVWCEDIEAMADLFLMFETRQLENVLENIFNLVKTSVKISNVVIRVTMAVNDFQLLKEAAQLNEVNRSKPERAEKYSSPDYIGGEELQPHLFSSQLKTDAHTELEMATVQLQMKTFELDPETAEPIIMGPQSQLNMEMVASENIKLKEIIESFERERSEHQKQLQLTLTDNAVLRKQLEIEKAERDQMELVATENIKLKQTMENSYYFLKQKTEQQCGNFAKMHKFNINVENRDVFGVTCLRNNIYLLTNQNIMAYQSNQPYLRNEVDDISIAEIEGAADIAACHKTSSLFVIDKENRCVWKIMANELKISKWLLEVDKPFTLSVTRDGRVLIPRSDPEPCLDVYNSRADLLNHFLLPVRSGRPLHAVETMKGNFIVSLYIGDIEEEYGIRELNDKGHVTRRPVFDTVASESPVYMVSGNDNWIFVARPDVHSITLFDKELCCDVITDEKDDIYNPQKLCYIRGKLDACSRLIILYGETSEVAVCTVPNAWHCLLKDWQIV